MTRSSKHLQLHVLVIAVVIGLGFGLTATNYYRLNKDASKVALNDGDSEHFISVQPLPNGLAKISFVRNDQIIMNGTGKKYSDAVINSDIGLVAATTVDTN